jgi:hypothetical protein
LPGWHETAGWRPNLVLYEWAAIVGTLLTQGLNNYRINGMYLEYANVDDPDDEVPVPDYDRAEASGVSYYDSLADSAQGDYLRVPLTAATLTSSDETNFPQGNDCLFFAQSQGTTGVHGKAFSAAANSKFFGAALVAMRDEDDPTQDLVLSRFYTDTDKQQVKLDASQIGVEWLLQLG